MNEPEIKTEDATTASATTTTTTTKTAATSSASADGAGGPPKGSFRRAKSRASRACEVCHQRKVRCDVTVHMPCTNCAAFGCECRIPEVKHRKSKNGTKKKNPKKEEKEKPPADISSRERTAALPQTNKVPNGSKGGGGDEDTAETTNDAAEGDNANTAALSDNSNMPQYGISNEQAVAAAKRLKKKKPVTEYSSSDQWDHLLKNDVKGAGRVAFLGSTSNLNLLLEDHTESYHYSLPDDSGRSRLSEIEKEEVDILKIRGAFLLPSRELCDDIVETYFEKVHPIIPIVNRAQFMRQYNDPSNPPSLLLLQAILLAGSRVCNNPALQDSTGSSELASMTFYKRAKSLYDANYETDRISIVQSTALMGWWWENPEELTKNSFYWTRVAISIAQGFGLHRSVEQSNMNSIDKKMWKRIWWALFVRDRYIALAMGRPYAIALEDCDVPMITEDDLDENEPGNLSPYPPNRVHHLYFIHSIKLAEIIGYILKQQFTVGAENSRRQNKLPNITHCDMAMATWMKNLPEEMKYSVGDRRNHDFFKGLLHSQYYTVLCLVHRSNIVHKPAGYGSYANRPHNYPSWGIAFQSAHMISMIMENMRKFNELQATPAFVVYNLFSSMITLLYQAESPSKTAAERASNALRSNLLSMREVGKKWIVGRMILKLFEHLEENPKIREKIVQTARKIRTREKGQSEHDKEHELGVSHAQVPDKRPADDREFEAPPPPKQRRNSGTNQSPLTASAKGAAASGSSPDFFFVTNTPPSSSVYIDNFQPSQLFPEVQDLSLHGSGSSQSVTPVDLSNPPQPHSAAHQTLAPHQQQPQQHNIAPVGMDMYNSPDDDSGSSTVAPSTLNIGDWYQFFATNADGQLPDVNSMMSALTSEYGFN